MPRTAFCRVIWSGSRSRTLTIRYEVSAWLNGLSREEHIRLNQFYDAPKEVVMDWILEHGGRKIYYWSIKWV